MPEAQLKYYALSTVADIPPIGAKLAMRGGTTILQAIVHKPQLWLEKHSVVCPGELLVFVTEAFVALLPWF